MHETIFCHQIFMYEEKPLYEITFCHQLFMYEQSFVRNHILPSSFYVRTVLCTKSNSAISYLCTNFPLYNITFVINILCTKSLLYEITFCHQIFMYEQSFVRNHILPSTFYVRRVLWLVTSAKSFESLQLAQSVQAHVGSNLFAIRVNVLHFEGSCCLVVKLVFVEPACGERDIVVTMTFRCLCVRPSGRICPDYTFYNSK